jgi:acetyl-CoA C-acetyltransferase
MTTTGLDPRTPVIVGVGQLDVPADEASPESTEPVDLMATALRAAADDSTSTRLLEAIDSIQVVAMLSWRYADPGRLVASRLGIDPTDTAVSTMGGNSPQALVNRAALDIAAGRHDVVAITGCEAWRTRQSARRHGIELPWTPASDDDSPARVAGTELEMSHPAELAHGIAMPVQVYPIFETALRAASGRTPAAHLTHIAELWAGFSRVAATNPHAAVPRAFSAEEIATPTDDNRWIGYPYTKWLVSNDRVDQAAALVVCSVERAEALGVPRDRWVFPHAGTDTSEPTVSLRWDLHRSPAMRVGGSRCLELAGVGVDDLAHLDVYSCFPSAVQIAADEIGFGLDRQLTVTGGLTFAGGPWNDYVTHSIATMVSVLRDDAGSIGFVTANGGLISKHAFGVYSTEPPTDGFRHDSPQALVDTAPHRDVVTDHDGPATIEAYTVMHSRDNEPERSLVSLLTEDGHRTWATTDDHDLMALLVAEEGCGRSADVRDGGLALR